MFRLDCNPRIGSPQESSYLFPAFSSLKYRLWKRRAPENQLHILFVSSFVLHLSLKNDVDVAPGCSWSRKPDETHRCTYIVHRVSVLHTAHARAAWRNRMPFNTSVASVFFCLLSYTRLYRTKCVHHHDDHRRRSQLACYPRILATLLLYLVSTAMPQDPTSN